MTNGLNMIFRTLVCLCLAIPSIAQASEDYSYETCNNLNSMYDFSVYTPILGNDPRETIYAERSDRKTGKNFTPVVLWTNELEENIGFPVIRDSRTSDNPAASPENIYYVWLTYKAENPSQGDNKTGLLTYYLYVNGDWEKVEEGEADLSGLAKPQLYVHGNESLPVECSVSTEPPEVPEPPSPEPDLDQVCRYFPEPAQGWSDQNSVSKLTVTNGNSNAQLKNWSVAYRNEFTFEKDTIKKPLLRTGFDLLVDEYGNLGGEDDYWQVYENNVCDTLGCEVGNDDNELYRREITPPEPVVLDASSNRELKITNSINENYFADVCEAPVCTYREYGDETTLYIHENLKSLNVIQRKPGRIIIKPDNGIHIGELSMAKQVDLYMRASHTLTVGKLYTSEQSLSMTFEDNVRINIASQFVAGNKINFNRVDGSRNVFLYGPNAEFIFNEPNSDFYGYILGKKVSINNPVHIYGSVTAQHLIMKKDVVIQKPDYSCPLPPVSDVETFIVEPQWKYGLTCERIPVDFKLVNEQSQLVDSDASFHPIVSPSNGASWCSGEAGDNCGIGGTNLVNGEKTLYLSVQDVGEYTIGANYDYESYSGGSVEFVPYKLHATPSIVEMIAGKDAAVSIQALSCYGDQTTVVKNYNSSLAMSLDNYELEKPSTGSLYDFNVPDLQFTNGSTDATVTWQDVGQTKVTFADANFDCRDYEQDGANLDCPIDGGVLKGEFTVKSRPWKIAACNIAAKNGGKLNPATQDTGDGFIAAGESFNVTYKPIVHSNSSGNANNVCEYPLTQNYFSDSNTAAPLDAEFSVLYPSDGDIANLDSSNVSSLEFSPENAKTGKTVEYVWHEVGSLSLKTKATYLDEKLNVYEVTVGRFYPGQFSVYENREAGMSTLWAYPNEQSFTYMGQPFGLKQFYIEALSKVGGSLRNYAYFGKSYQAKFNLYENNSDNVDRFIAQSDYSGSWLNDANDAHVSGQSVGKFSAGDLVWNKVVSKPDGPLNYLEKSSDTSISIAQSSSSVDKTGVTIGTKELNVQPDIRFGRVDLDDVGGRQGETLYVPLRVEYWNGSRFVVNSNDSQTDVSGIKWGQDHIWPTGEGAAPKDVNLGDGGEVSFGSSRSVTATQAESYRQQTRVWLDLEANGLPWLKYDWDNDGSEENPSSVVTFGIHRGNDRVIYRGEPGLTAQ